MAEIHYFLRFKGNENDVDLRTLMNVCNAFTKFLNSAAIQLALSKDICKEADNRFNEKHSVVVSMQQTEKGSCVIPLLVDVVNGIDTELLKSAVGFVLSSVSEVFNSEFWRDAAATVAGGIVVDRLRSLKDKGHTQTTVSSREESSISGMNSEIESLRANENVYQEIINLFSAIAPSSLNTEFSIEDEDRKIILKAARSQQDILESPLTESVDFSGQMMQIVFKQWNDKKETDGFESFSGVAFGESRVFKVNECCYTVLREAGVDSGRVLDASVSGKMMTKRETGRVYYRDLRVEEICRLSK